MRKENDVEIFQNIPQTNLLEILEHVSFSKSDGEILKSKILQEEL